MAPTLAAYYRFLREHSLLGTAISWMMILAMMWVIPAALWRSDWPLAVIATIAVAVSLVPAILQRNYRIVFPWLYLNTLDSVSTLGKLIAFYVDEHNRRLPHSAFRVRGQTPDEMYFGTGKEIPNQLEAATKAARQTRLEVNRLSPCRACEPLTNLQIPKKLKQKPCSGGHRHGQTRLRTHENARNRQRARESAHSRFLMLLAQTSSGENSRRKLRNVVVDSTVKHRESIYPSVPSTCLGSALNLSSCFPAICLPDSAFP